MDNAAAEVRYADAARRAMDAFGLGGADVRIVTVSENVTFRVDAGSGGSFVLRLHRPGYHTLAELDSERIWTAALAAAGVEAPQGLETSDGRNYVHVAAADGEVRWAGVTRWIEGTPLETVLDGAEHEAYLPHFESVGAIAARVHDQASGWAAPSGFTRHAFDTEGFFGASPFWGRFWESPALSSAERKLVVDTRDAIRGVLERYGVDERGRGPSCSRYSMIHADLHFGNVLAEGDRIALIDFDDAGFGWHHYELAVILFGQPHDRLEANLQALLAGYRSVRSFPDADAALVPMFLVIRALALLGWIEQRPELQGEDRVVRQKDYACAMCRDLDLDGRVV